MIYLRLFWEFFKTGLFAVGGGLATIPFLQNISETTGWFTSAELANMIAVSESTPGPLGVNMATYVGFETGGILGAVIATLGLIAPSIIVIIIIAGFLKKFRESKYVEYVFYGLRPASTGLIAAACWSVISISILSVQPAGTDEIFMVLNWKLLLLALAVYFCTNHEKLKKLHPVVWIALSAVIGIVFQL
ncbi:MAG: chromate transporter [Oscillospiraceae bacterium]|nr:chromate transporter [Oscillospiraceae bacterium]